ncbi:hypothetical protein PFISCL1PPCAC_13554, partial [Pristionchus fissidentatus]
TENIFQVFPLSQFLILRITRRKKSSRFDGKIYNVNSRYQVHDFERCARMLNRYVLFQGVCWALVVGASSAMVFLVLQEHPEYTMITEQIGYTLHGPRAVASMFIPILSHAGLKKTVV